MRQLRNKINDISFLTQAERKQILVKWNQTEADYPQDKTIHQLFEEQVERTPDNIALIFEDNELTYRELNSRANQVAHTIRSHFKKKYNQPLPPETLVALCLERSLEMVIGILGILKAGASYVPLDSTYPNERLRYMLEDSAAPILLTQANLLRSLSFYSGGVFCLDGNSVIEQASCENPVTTVKANHLAYVFYTSGSTGRPKGVATEHGAIVNRIIWMRDYLQFSQNDRVLQKTPYVFDVSVWEFILPIVNGATLVIAQPEDHKDPYKIISAIRKYGITCLHFVPSMLGSFLQVESLEKESVLKKVICSGEVLSPSLVGKFFKRLNAKLYNLYGPTEAAIDVTAFECEVSDQERTSIPIGKPIANTQIYILDDNQKVVPIGVIGELYIGGVGVARGYFNKPELTKERFIENPFASAEDRFSGKSLRLYRTGDLGRWLTDGNIDFLGRIDHQVKVRGFRVECGEIEQALLANPGIEQVVVIAQDGELGIQLVAYYVAKLAVREFKSEDLRHHLMQLLPDYMVPQFFVELSAFPLTVNGKLDRKALPPANESTLNQGIEYALPRDEIEREFVEIWQEVLKRDRVGIHGNFFSIGGDSIMSIQVVARAKQDNIIITPKQLFQYSTIAELSKVAQRVEAKPLDQNIVLEQVPLVKLNQSQLDIIQAKFPKLVDLYPLSPLQEGLLFHALYAPKSDQYITQIYWDYKGELNEVALREAWQGLVDQHPILRTSFLTEGVESPIQVVEKGIVLPWTYEDWQTDGEAGKENALTARFARYVQRDRLRGFDLSNGPLLRCHLIKSRRDHYTFLWTHHHILLDGWCWPLILKQVHERYRSLVIGEPSSSADGRRYCDYIDWLGNQDKNVAKAFWQKHLSGTEAPTNLGIEKAGVVLSIHEPIVETREVIVCLSKELTRTVDHFAKISQVTINTVLQAAYARVLSQYSGQKEVIFGVTVSGRAIPLEGIDQMVGLFINTLPLKVSIDEKINTVDQLKRLQIVMSDLNEYSYLSLAEIQGVSGIPAGSSLFYSLYVFENYPIDDVGSEILAELSLENMGVHEKTNYPLVLTVEPGKQIMMKIAYDPLCFEEDSIKRMAQHLEQVIIGMVSQSQGPLSAVELLTQAERQQILIDWNQTKVDYPSEETFITLFEKQASLYPQKPAIRQNGESLNYVELEMMSLQVAHNLIENGCQKGDLVGLYLERSIPFIVAVIGIMRAGGVYLPLDSSQPPARLTQIIKESDLTYAWTIEERHQELQAIGNDLTICTLSNPKKCQLPDLFPDDLAYILYTSGSTGVPKGVMVEHRGMLNHMFAKINDLGMTHEDILAQNAAMTFDISVWQMLTPLVIGGQVEVCADDVSKDPEILMDRIEATEVTIVELVPSMLQMILEFANRPLEKLKWIISTGEALTKTVAERWLKFYPSIPLLNAYGPAECSDDVTHYAIRTLSDVNQPIVSIGKTVQNTQIYIVDQNLRPVPLAIPGEICVGGVCVARGYLNRPELTKERFIENPFATAEDKASGKSLRLYRTGDLGSWLPDGLINFLGRIDHQVKIRGFRIECGEIEHVLLAHPAIDQVVVVAQEGDLGKQLVAYYVAKEVDQLTTEHLRHHLMQRLPDYMVPQFFVELSAFPVTPNGKLDRKALPRPSQETQHLETDYAPPRDTLEQKLVEIWQEVLKRDQVGIHDNFFSIGGDSIVSIQVVSRAKRENITITPKQIFQYPTIEQLSTVAQRLEVKLINQSIVVGSVPLTPIQYWFFNQIKAVPHHFNQAFLFEAKEFIEVDCLKKAIDKVFNHYDGFRLRYRQYGLIWEQAYDENVLFDVETRSLSQVSAAEQSQLIEVEAALVQASLDISSAPLVRVVLMSGHQDGYQRLLIVIHHLIVDGVSWRILLEDLELAYLQVKAKQEIRLSIKTDTMKRWSEELAVYAQTPMVERERSYWLKLSENLPKIVFDETTDLGIGHCRIELSAEETEDLLTQIHEVYHTQINDVLLSALSLAMLEVFGSSDILLHLEGHGREDILPQVDVSRTIGWFTTLFPVRLKIERSLEDQAVIDLADLLISVKENLRSIPQKGIGYGLLRYLNVKTSQADVVEEVKWKALDAAPISFNYLGQLDASLNEGRLLREADETCGLCVSEENLTGHLIDINGAVSGKCLWMNFSYHRSKYKEETIERLTRAYASSLRALIKHCKAQVAHRYTPSDFPLARLKQAQLDIIQAKLPTLVDAYPLSPLQEGLLFHALYAPESDQYVTQTYWDYKGEIDEMLLREAWQGLIDLHPILRTSFLIEGVESPIQVVEEEIILPWHYEDWQEEGEASEEKAFKALFSHYLERDRLQGFDMSEVPLMRCHLIKRRRDHYTFLWTHHHILLDGWCWPLILKEIHERYRSLVKRERPFIVGERRYCDYIDWLEHQDKSVARNFWKEHLSGIEAPTNLGIEKAGAVLSIHEPIVESRDVVVCLSEELTQAIDQFARKSQVTINTIIQTAYARVLSQYSGQKEVVFGVTVSGRSIALVGIDQMLGLFINTLPFRVSFDEKMSTTEQLKQVQKMMSDLNQYSYLSLADIQGVSRIPAGTPLFYSLYVFENYPIDEAGLEVLPGLSVENMAGLEKTNYPLGLIVVPGKQLLMKITYDTLRFEDESIKRMSQHLEQVIRGMVSQPQKALTALELLTAVERQQITVDWNQTEAFYPKEKTIHQMFEEQVEQNPNNIALVFENKELTYGELNAKANQIAHTIRSHYEKNYKKALSPDTLIALCLERSLEMMIGILGILKAGAAYVPLDPSYPKDRLRYMLEDTAAPILLTQNSLIEPLSFYSGKVLCVDWDSEIAQASCENPVNSAKSTNLAYVIYTSGSTGLPKGVMIEHSGIVSLAYRTNIPKSLGEINSTSKFLQVVSFSFDASVGDWSRSLLNGASLLIFRDFNFEYSMFSGVTHAVFPSAMLSVIPADKLKSVECITSMGDVCSEKTINEISDFSRLLNGYGPTETTVETTIFQCKKNCSGQIIGKPIANKKLYVLDRYLQPCPIGVTGELYIGGVGIARGYLNQPELTRERFIQNPFVTVEDKAIGANLRLYRTGDLGRWLSDGNAEFLGRVDHQVKIRGFRIECGEIEHVLLAYPCIEQAVVIAQDGEVDKQLVAYYVVNLQASREFTTEAFRDYLLERLPEYMVPQFFVELPAFPLSSNGKLDRKALLQENQVKLNLVTNYVAPRNALEQKLVEIWQEVLKRDRVGINDSFFECGGNSLLAVQVISRIKRFYGVDLPLKFLFQNLTIHKIAPIISEKFESTRKDRESPFNIATGKNN